MAKLKDRYANALLEISVEHGTLEKDLAQAVLVRDALNKPDVQGFLLQPHIPDSAKHQLFHTAFSDDLAKHLMGFLYLLVRKNRESLIIPALNAYIDRTNRRLGRIEAKIVSAKPLTGKQIEAIRTVLAKKIDLQFTIKATVDPDVVGGFYVLIDGQIFDGTVRSNLNMMREHLKRGISHDR